MYQIGLFSKLNHITVKTLHHYEKMGLLKPAYIDPKTNYRYYQHSQGYEVHRISALKKLGFSLDEIHQILNGQTKHRLLLKRKLNLLKELSKISEQLSQVEYYLAHEDDPSIFEYEVLIKSIPEVIVASQRRIISNYQSLFECMPIMGEKMERLGCVCAQPSYCFNIYHDGEYREENIDVEICEAIEESREDDLGLVFKTIPAIPTAACVFHKGPYEEFPQVYLSIMKWLDCHGYEVVDYPRESYIDGIWNKEDPQQWLTEIQVPITKKEA